MRVVPELVFLNGAHMARLESASRAQSGGHNNSLSAAFAVLGARAVIASAGAIRDAEAVAFATQFYSVMMRGEPLWRAVLDARRKAYQLFPDSSTWAAYRCYGDPEFTLTGLSLQRLKPSDLNREPKGL